MNIIKQYFLYIIDLIPAPTKEGIGETSTSFLISTVKQFADLLSDGKLSNIAMLVVDNGHSFVKNSDDSTAKVLEFIQANSLIQKSKQEYKAGGVDEQQSSRSSKARVIVFTANFLNYSQTNGQLVEVDHEFEKLKKHFLGNKVHGLFVS